MIEIVIPIVVLLVFVGAGLVAWRLATGPANQRLGLALRVVILSLTGLLLISTCVWRLSNSRTFQFFGEIVPRVETSAPVVALTFDDGPSPRYAPQVLTILREQDVKATFFVTGQALEEHMAAAHSIVAEGHELGNHSFSHQRMIGKPYAFIQQEIERTDQLIRETGYSGDIHFRPPYGKKFILLPYYLSRTGRSSIFMDVAPDSYPEVAADADKIVEHVLSKARPGSIILLHVMADSRDQSRRAIPGIIYGLQDRGYRFVTVSELLTTPPAPRSVPKAAPSGR
jgi:peptidoglycan/xylan/chitin deacetylase (PgdA/CDA1 family)